MSGANKVTSERNQRMLLDLTNLPGNDVCADCKAKNPRWASHNLGIFICVNCASIHRKIGTHITKVKSLTLDSWTKEQVENMKDIGNIRSNVRYNPDERRHPPPTNMIDSERDSDLEKYIRGKYEFKSFMDPSSSHKLGSGFDGSLNSSRSLERAATVKALLGPSRSAAHRLSTAPAAKPQPPPPKFNVTTAPTPSTTETSAAQPSQASLGLGTPSSLNAPKAPLRAATQPASSFAQAPAYPQTQHTVLDATLPLQYAPPTPASSQPVAIPMSTQSSFLSAPSANMYTGLSASPISPFPTTFAQMQAQATGMSSGPIARSMSLNTGLSSQPYTGGLSVSPSLPGGVSSSPFQPNPITTTTSLPMMGGQSSPNPFQSQGLPVVGTGMGVSHQIPNGFGTTPFIGQQATFQQQQAQLFQPQPTTMQVPTAGNPFMQPQMTNMSTTPQFTSTPSPLPFSTQFQQSQPSSLPFGATQMQPQGFQQMQPQGFQQMQPGMQPFQQQPMQQHQQPGFGAANPFTSWVKAPSQPGMGGFGQGQQQWGGM